MGARLFETFTNWSGGVVTSVFADACPPTASPRGYNSQLEDQGLGQAGVRKRRGFSVVNVTPTTSSSAIIGQAEFKELETDGTFTRAHLGITAAGQLVQRNSDDTLTSLAAAATFVATTSAFPDFAEANNCIFIVNGTNAKKWNGTALTGIGITAPAAAPGATGGAAGNMSGVWDIAIAYKNSGTGHVSSRSAYASTTNLSSQLTTVTWTASTDAQVDEVVIYVRKGTLSSQFWQATTAANATETANINISDATFLAYVTIAPTTISNDPPPSGIKYACYHKGRMFFATDTTVYWSKAHEPESFNLQTDYEPINLKDGQKITGLLSKGDVLIIFKTDSTWGIFGDSPQSWVISPIYEDIGNVSHRSIVRAEGYVGWWSQTYGPQLTVDFGGRPRQIGNELISETIGPANLDYSQLSLVAGVYDALGQRILWAVPELNATANTLILPFSTNLLSWESNKWDPMVVSSWGVADDADGQPKVYLGGAYGQFFKWDDAESDGMRSTLTDAVTPCAKTGTFTATSTSQSSISLTASAVLDTEGSGLVGRRITVVDSNIRQVATVRPQITTNTTTTLTLDVPITGLTVASAYSVYIGGPAFEWDTKWGNYGDPWSKKRYEYLFVHMKTTSSAVNAYLEMAFTFDTAAGALRDESFDTDAPSATWDSDLWDSSVWGTFGAMMKRIRIGRTGREYRLRVRQLEPDKQLSLLKVGVQAERLGTRLG